MEYTEKIHKAVAKFCAGKKSGKETLMRPYYNSDAHEIIATDAYTAVRLSNVDLRDTTGTPYGSGYVLGVAGGVALIEPAPNGAFANLHGLFDNAYGNEPACCAAFDPKFLSQAINLAKAMKVPIVITLKREGAPAYIRIGDDVRVITMPFRLFAEVTHA